MDSDGEDDFTKINKMVNLAKENKPCCSFCRTKRGEVSSLVYYIIFINY